MSKSKKKKLLQRVYPHYNEIDPLPSIIADNHTHIDLGNSQYVDNPLTVDELLISGKETGVKKVVQSSTSLKSSKFSSGIASKYDDIIAAVGIHPNDAPDLYNKGVLDKHLIEIKKISQNNKKIRAIGETGLDFFRTPLLNDQKIQKQSFIKQINIANELNLALQIHDRNAHKEILEILEEEKAPSKTVFHCFSANKGMAEFVSKKGWYLSFAGNITFNANNELRDALKIIPINKILVETDAPFLTPVPFRGRPNISYLTACTVQYIANFLKIELKELCEQILQNTFNVYGKW